MSRSQRKQDRKVKVRNWLVVDARSRHTAGQMGDQRKKESREACRKWKHNKED